MRLSTRQAVVWSVASHAAAGVVLGLALRAEVLREREYRVETSWEPAVAMDAPDPLPPLAEEPEAVPPVEEAAALVEADLPEEETDPRLAADAGPAAEGTPSSADREATNPWIGVGAGGLRVLPRRRALAPRAPAPPLLAEAPPPPVAKGPTRPPRPVPGACAEPAYPNRERRLGIEGTVVLRVDVAEDGAVLVVEVEASSGSGPLDAAAVAAVLGWRFEPALRDGTAVADRYVFRVHFRIDVDRVRAEREERR
jgi:protein TonB